METSTPRGRLALASGAAFNVSAVGGYSPPSNLTIIGTGGTVYGEFNHSAGTLSPGTGTLTIGSLNFNNGTLHLNGGDVQFDLNTGTTVGGGVNDLITVGSNGTLDINGSTPVIVNFLSAPAPGSVYNLIDYPTNRPPVRETRHAADPGQRRVPGFAARQFSSRSSASTPQA